MVRLLGVLCATIALCAVLQAGEPAPASTTESSLHAVLANELASMWTRDADRLVQELDAARRASESSPSLSFLLAVAHTETNGKILTISTAGAVGLAQATPIAYLAEGFSGKLFVTPEYLEGSRAYVQKKPLGDAAAIAEYLAEGDSKSERRYARELLDAAYLYVREGVDDLKHLEPWASEGFLAATAQADRYNRDVLDELGTLIASGTLGEIKEFATKRRAEYRALKETQNRTWTKYQKDLVAERERVIREFFPGEDPAAIIRTRAWEAGEVLARELDDRFSGPAMAKFLVAHLRRKIDEAKSIAFPYDDLDEVASALYNGGAPNVYRMRAGLIVSLVETQRYMKKVPATKRRLDRIVDEQRIDPFAIGISGQ